MIQAEEVTVSWVSMVEVADAYDGWAFFFFLSFFSGMGGLGSCMIVDFLCCNWNLLWVLLRETFWKQLLFFVVVHQKSHDCSNDSNLLVVMKWRILTEVSLLACLIISRWENVRAFDSLVLFSLCPLSVFGSLILFSPQRNYDKLGSCQAASCSNFAQVQIVKLLHHCSFNGKELWIFHEMNKMLMLNLLNAN